MVKWTQDQLSMWHLMTSEASPNATSSPGSAGGPTPSASPGGPTTGLFGQDRARASRSPQPGKARAKRTSATSGPSSSTSSAPADPLSLWESKLRRRLASLGSTECMLTWKESVTPAGRPLSRLVPSMRPIEEIACGLWPTPTVGDNRSPSTMASAQREWDHSNLRGIAAVSMWPTPNASDEKWRYSTQEAAERRAASGKQVGLECAAHLVSSVKMWGTPTCHMANEGGYPAEFTRKTPTMTAEAYTALGMTASGSPEQTERPGALNPEFVSWLMGFPTEWDACAPMEMPSRRRWQQKS